MVTYVRLLLPPWSHMYDYCYPHGHMYDYCYPHGHICTIIVTPMVTYVRLLLPPWSHMYVTRTSSCICMDLLLMWFTEHFLKHKASGKAILLLDDHRSHCKVIVASCNFAKTPKSPLAVKTNTILEYLVFGKVSSNTKRGLTFNPLNPELNPICYLLALLGDHQFLHVSRIRVKLLNFRRLMSYIYGAPILDVSRSHTTTQHSR